MMIFRILLAAIALAFAVPPAEAVEIQTATGPVTVEATPGRVAVFDIAALDTIDRLGIRPAGVPENLYLPELAHLKEGAAVVGDIFEPDLEALSALQPDLIIVGGRSSPQAHAAARVAPTIDMTMDGDDLLAQAKERLAAYGALFGREEEAAAALQELEEAVEAARRAVAGRGTALIVMTNGPKVTAYGTGSRFGWVHEALGLEPAVEDVQAATHGEAISFEFIREADPDWLIVLDRAAAIGSADQNARATLDNELVAETTAWREGQVIYMPAPDFYIAAGGIQATTRVLRTIADAFAATE
jgi:iron complex transport system substrate-binding protein